eukprot:315657-Amphidinium_carterae.1
MSTGTLQSAYQEGVQEVNSKTTAWGKPTGTLHCATHRALYEYAPISTVHIQSTVESIEREATLDGELF